MKVKKILFTFSLFTIVGFATTSCSGSGFRHTPNKYLDVYSADLDHNGIAKTNLNWSESYDALIEQTTSMASLEKAADALNIAKNIPERTSLARYEILHEAEELLMSTGTIVPLYNYGDPYLLKPNVRGISTVNLGYKFMDRLKYTDSTNKSFKASAGTKAQTFDPASNSDASTSLIMNQFLVGAKRYVRGVQDPSEKADIYLAKLSDNNDDICSIEKKLVTNDPNKAAADPTYVYIHDKSKCPDLDESISKGLEQEEDYEDTARYIITVKNNAVWNNGEHILAEDFIYEWTRASSGVYNKNKFGVWCSLFDSIRGYKAWNTIGQREHIDNIPEFDPNSNYDAGTVVKCTKNNIVRWGKTINDYHAGDATDFDDAASSEKGCLNDLTAAETYQYISQFNDYGCAGGMRGIMPDPTNPRKFTVQLINNSDVFEQLLAFTAFMPVDKSVIRLPNNATKEYEKTHICEELLGWWKNENGTFHTNGPLQIDGSFENQPGTWIKLKKADNFTPGINLVHPDTVDRLDFQFIADPSTQYKIYENGGFQFVNNFPTDVIDDLIRKDTDWHVAQQLGSYFYSMNVNDNTFDTKNNVPEPEGERTREKLRQIVNLLINRFDISKNVNKKGSTPATGFVSKGITETCVPVWDNNAVSPQGGNGAYVAKKESDGKTLVTMDWTDRNKDRYSNLIAGDYKKVIMDKREGGGFVPVSNTEAGQQAAMDECAKQAIDIAKSVGINYDASTGKFTNFPHLNILTNSGGGHEEIAERIQAYYGLWGIETSIRTEEWQSFTNSRRLGDFAIARQGWVADYNDPRTYLDLARTEDGNNDTQLGKDSFHYSH